MNITELKAICAKAKVGWYDKTREDFNADELSFCGVFSPKRVSELLERIEELEAREKKLMAVVEECNYRLQPSRIWGGTGWVYRPMPPFKYKPLLELIQAALTDLEKSS